MTGPDVHIRRALPDDRKGVWPLARDFATSFRPEEAIFDRSFEALVNAPDTLLSVAVNRSSDIVGYLLASTHLTLFANGPVAWVEEVMVAEPLRGAGVGRLLMADAEVWARDAGAAYVSLASRRARDFYLALGYEESATLFRKPRAGAPPAATE